MTRGAIGAPPVELDGTCSVLDALHILQDQRTSHCLIRSASGEPSAMLDVLQLVCASVSYAERSADAQQVA